MNNEKELVSGHDGPVVRMRPCSSRPVIDGTVRPGEWDDALLLAGSQTDRGGLLEQREAQMHLAFDSCSLYVALRSQTAPGNLLNFWPQPPDRYESAVDGIELWVAPLPTPDAVPTDVFQFWWNPDNAFYGKVIRHGVGFNFRGETEFQNTIEDDWWTLETAVPWSSLGVDGDTMAADGTHFLVRPTRNWKNPFVYSSWGGPGAFANTGAMIRVIVDSSAPAVQVPELGSILQGRPDIRLELRGGEGLQKYKVSLRVEDEKGNLIEKVEDSPAPSSGCGRVRFAKPFRLSGNMSLAIDVVRVADGCVLLRRRTALSPPRPHDWLNLEPAGVSLRGGYYPYHRKARAVVDLAGLKDAGRITRAGVEVRPEGSEQVLGRGDVTRFDYNRGEVTINLPELPDGKYEMRATLFEGDRERTLDEPVTHCFERFRQEWEHNDIGKTDVIYPPFTPLEVDGSCVSCVQRRHELDGLGLWKQVWSMNRPLLGEPVRLELVSDGRAISWDVTDKPRFTRLAEHSIEVEGRAESEKLSVHVGAVWDYDGGVRYEMTLEPRGDGNVDELTLVIPFRRQEAGLFHTHSMIRSNPQGSVPDGEGVVWDSATAVRLHGEQGTMIPYIWLGGAERGIAWWAENDRGWITDDDEAAVRIVRSGDRVLLQIRLINRSCTVAGRRTIVFGLMATPAKPQPEGWRGWGQPPRPWICSLVSHYFAGLSDCESLMPVGNDWEGARLLAGMRDEGRYDENAVMKWLARHGLDNDARALEMTPRLFKNLAVKGREIILYVNPPLESLKTPQGRTFGWEWRGEAEGIAGRKTSSYIDYAVYAFDKMLESGLNGIYHDNTWPMPNSDCVSGNGYEREDGKIETGWDIWEQREFYRRLYAAAWERTGKYPLIWVHNTNGHIAAYFSFATMAYGPEWSSRLGAGYSNAFQQAFPFDLLRAGPTGRQAGLMHITLNHYGKAPEKVQPFLTRTLVGTSLLHDMRPLVGTPLLHDSSAGVNWTYLLLERLNETIGYYDPALEVLPYWSNRGFVTSDRGLEVTLYRNGSTVAALACSVAGEEGVHTHHLELDTAKLGISDKLSASDLEDRPGLEQTGDGAVRFDLGRHDFRFILFRPGTEARCRKNAGE